MRNRKTKNFERKWTNLGNKILQISIKIRSWLVVVTRKMKLFLILGAEIIENRIRKRSKTGTKNNRISSVVSNLEQFPFNEHFRSSDFSISLDKAQLLAHESQGSHKNRKSHNSIDFTCSIEIFWKISGNPWLGRCARWSFMKRMRWKGLKLWLSTLCAGFNWIFERFNRQIFHS